MSSLYVVNSLTSVFVIMGVLGAVVAVICAVIAGIALAIEADGIVGGAVGIWIPAVLLCAAAGFAQVWTPAIVAVAALVLALAVGGVLRSRLRSRELTTVAF